jgi:glycosyltransferase involved in cell wall biosynthesis
MKGRPRVLWVTPFPPYPPDNGGMLRILSLARRLTDRFDLSLLTFARETGERRFQQNAALLALRRVFSEVHCVPKETAELPAEAVPPLPSICREWYSPSMAALLQRLVIEGRADLVHVEFLLMAFYAWYCRGAPRVLTEHDSSHLSLRRSYFREWTGLKRWARLGDWLSVRRYHRSVCGLYDRVVALTPADQERLRRTLAPERVALVPTCVDLERFSARPAPAEEPPGLVYVGHYPHYPNEDAAVWFCERILPRIRAERPDATLTLVGSHPTDRVRSLARPWVAVTGSVPDVRPYLDRAAVFVAPIRLGYGVKGKVLEAFARGVPVVATPSVHEGLPGAVAGEHLLVARTPSEFAAAVLRLLGDGALRGRLASGARRLAEERCDWAGSARRLAELYEELLA